MNILPDDGPVRSDTWRTFIF